MLILGRRGKQLGLKKGGAKNYQKFIAEKRNKEGNNDGDDDEERLAKESSYVAYEITQNDKKKIVRIIYKK